jgi:hypothetical protein
VTPITETITIILRNVPDFYDVIVDKKQIDLLLTDGPDHVQIFTTANLANPDCNVNGEIKIVRQGSLDQDLKIKLAIQISQCQGNDHQSIHH